jgi:endonuclease-3
MREELLDLNEAILAVTNALEETFGVPGKPGMGDPLDGLIQTILSQNTNDRNRDRAFLSLKDRFPTWEAVLKAGSVDLEEAIRVGGLAKTKAVRIIRLLENLQRSEDGLNLDRLRRLAPQEAEKTLLSIQGVGKKTARCVMLFELNHAAFPVDTHILRVTRRLGWIPERASADRAHDILQEAVPPKFMLSLHINLIQLGRTHCRPKGPKCAPCPINGWCSYPALNAATTSENPQSGSPRNSPSSPPVRLS